MGTQHLMATASLCDLFHESDLCPDEILTILQSLDDDNNINIFNMAVSSAAAAGLVPEDKKRKKPAKTASSSSPGLGSDEESDKDDHAVLSQRKSFKRQKISLSPPPTSMDDGSGEDGGTAGRSFSNGKLVSHVAVERNRRKQMNEHLAVLRQLMPCFYVKKGDQASIVGGVIDYITELQQILQSLEAKKQRKIYAGEVGQSPRIASSPRLLAPQQHLNPSPLLSPRPLLSNLPISPRTPQSSSIRSPTSNSCSDMIMMMMKKKKNRNSNNGVANELVASSKSSIADVEVKFCGPNLELKTLSSKIAGQTVKIVSAIEDLSLEILQLSINTADETLLNAFTIKIGIECKLSAEELAQQIQQTFC